MFRKDDHRNSPDSLSVSKQPKSWYRCCVCGTTSRKTPDRKFFRFPKDPIRSKQWAAACSNQDLLNKSPTDLYKTAQICSSHFKDHDYCSPKMRYLHSCAVPTKFEQTGIYSVYCYYFNMLNNSAI
ncbi:52 kDa repressor of the inhibitor of the protein kinase-like [Stegodyphus dumicola]|uniref:52 kDa repressor of the inhibitor of the protein kinase-like n=1 Tax=Stegodyphus dumicola TaxID=202533 RepID=UPI0015ACAE0B|nr:52 kDa repressor of the inhibitor of the protein kinase-like [Stegodyphus dumicola]